MQELNRHDVSDSPWVVNTSTHAAYNFQTHTARVQHPNFVSTTMSGEVVATTTRVTVPATHVFSYEPKYSARIKKRRVKNKAAHKQRMKNKTKKG